VTTDPKWSLQAARPPPHETDQSSGHPKLNPLNWWLIEERT